MLSLFESEAPSAAVVTADTSSVSGFFPGHGKVKFSKASSEVKKIEQIVLNSSSLWQVWSAYFIDDVEIKDV